MQTLMLAKSSFYAFRATRPKGVPDDWQHPVVETTGEVLMLRDAGQAAQAAFFQEVRRMCSMMMCDVSCEGYAGTQAMAGLGWAVLNCAVSGRWQLQPGAAMALFGSSIPGAQGAQP